MDNWMREYSGQLASDPSFTDNTRSSYQRDIADFAAAMERSGIHHPHQLLPVHIRQYLQQLRLNGKSAATISRRLVSIRALCRYGVRQGVLRNDPSLGLDAPRPEPKPSRTLGMEEVAQLLDAPVPEPDSPAALRDGAMLELLYATGMNVSELIALDMAQFRQELSALQITGAHRRERIVPIGEIARRKLQSYLARGRPALLKPDKPESAIFVNLRGARLSRQGCWKIIRERAHAAGLAGDLTPQMLRRSFAVHMLDNGADVRAVQEMLGHTHPQSTLRYGAAARSGVIDIYERAHPRAAKLQE